MSKPTPQAWLLTDKIMEVLTIRIDAIVDAVKGDFDGELFAARLSRARVELAQEVENTMRFYAHASVDHPGQN